MFPLPGHIKSFKLYTYMVYLHNICKWEAGSRGGHTFKLKMAMTLFLKYLTGNKFALIYVSMIRMCNKIKIKARLFQKHILWLVLQQILAS